MLIQKDIIWMDVNWGCGEDFGSFQLTVVSDVILNSPPHWFIFLLKGKATVYLEAYIKMEISYLTFGYLRACL